MSSNTLTVEEFDNIIHEMTGYKKYEGYDEKTSCHPNKILREDNYGGVLTVTFAVLEDSGIVEYMYSINDVLFTELLGKFVACKQETDPNRQHGCEALEEESTTIKKGFKYVTRTLTKEQSETHNYKVPIRYIINIIKTTRQNKSGRIKELENLFVSRFDNDNYKIYNQNYKNKNCNIMMESETTREIIKDIYIELSQINNMNVLSDKEKESRRPISETFKQKLQNTKNMDQLLKFFKLFNNSAQLYGTKKCALGGRKRRKTKLKKRRKKRKSQKKRKLKS